MSTWLDGVLGCLKYSSWGVIGETGILKLGETPWSCPRRTSSNSASRLNTYDCSGRAWESGIATWAQLTNPSKRLLSRSSFQIASIPGFFPIQRKNIRLKYLSWSRFQIYYVLHIRYRPELDWLTIISEAVTSISSSHRVLFKTEDGRKKWGGSLLRSQTPTLVFGTPEALASSEFSNSKDGVPRNFNPDKWMKFMPYNLKSIMNWRIYGMWASWAWNRWSKILPDWKK